MATLSTSSVAIRLQALRSTGPRTPEGKLVASLNSTKHGLSKVGLRPPAEMAHAIEDRKASWHKNYGPRGPAQQWHYDRLCAESVRLDFCEKRLLAAHAEAAQRASESWDDDRNAEIAALAAKLGSRPDEIQPKLLRSRHGVLWMLERWQQVVESVRHRRAWTEESWALALDLLGAPLRDRGNAKPTDHGIDQVGPEAADRLALTAMTALEERLEAILIPQDDRARSDAEAGLSDKDTPEIRRLERYAADARRRVASHLSELRRLQAAEGGGPGPETATAPHRLEVPAAARVECPNSTAPPLGAETNSGAKPAPSALSAQSHRPTLSEAVRKQIVEQLAPRNRQERRARKATARRS